mgnify:FL=1
MAMTNEPGDRPVEHDPHPDYLPPRKPWAEPYWEALPDGKLLLQHCEQCNAFAYPPVDERCSVCKSPTSWREASGQARLWSWIVFHHEFFAGYPLPAPYTVLMLDLAEGIRMLATLAGAEPADLACDAPMEFLSREVAPGVFIPGFAPA